MKRVRLGAVEYLNARPLVHGLQDHPEIDLRFDVPSRCAELLHQHAIDVGLIPSIEYLRGPADTRGPSSSRTEYQIVPDLAIASRGAVASVALFTTKSIRDVRTIALDTSSRTSVALVRVLCARVFDIAPRLESRGPDIGDMLAHADAALLIGDTALLLPQDAIEVDGTEGRTMRSIEKIDLGAVWTAHTGLPFVYAFWAGRPHALSKDDVRALQATRDQGVAHSGDIARQYFSDPDEQALATRYLRDNIKYSLGPDECEGLRLFYRLAAELQIVEQMPELRFY